jgi:hypothetical protein
MMFLIGMAGIVLLYLGVMARFQRRQDRNSELVELNDKIRAAEFLGENAEKQYQALSEKLTEHDSWRKNINFEVGNWITFVIAGALLLLALVLGPGEGRTPTWDRLWDSVTQNAWYLFAFGYGFYYIYLLEKRLAHTDREIKWLNHILKQVYWKTKQDRSELEYELNELKRS